MSEKSLDGVWEYEKQGDDEVIITGYIGNETDVIIPEKIDGMTVTAIWDGAFEGKNIESVKLPKTLDEIHFMAFAGCENLVSVYLPDSLKDIGIAVFEGCKMLKSINIPDQTFICTMAFTDCPCLADNNGFVIIKNIIYGYYGEETEIIIPDGIEDIDYRSFKENKKYICKVSQFA